MRKKNFVIRPENSIPNQAKIAPSIKPFIKFCKEKNCSSIIDVGSGRLRNLSPLLKTFDRIWLVDTKLQHERIKPQLEKIRKHNSSFKGFIDTSKFTKTKLNASAAMVVCVLHAIPNKEKRLQILKHTRKNLRNKGLLLLDIPYGESYYKPRMKKSNKHLDGFIIGNGRVRTFHKEFSRREVLSLLSKSRFEILTELKISSHHHALICQK